MNPFVLDLLYALEDPIIFEFGACDGGDTIELAQFGFKKFYTFEPDPRNLEIIRKRGLPDGVVLVPKAVGRSVGRAHLYQSTNVMPEGYVWTASSSLKEPNKESNTHYDSNLKFDAKVDVDVVSLDSFCQEFEIPYIDFIWADIQGAEVDLIAGGKEMIPRTHYLFMEHESSSVYQGVWSYKEMLAALPGWRVLEKFPNDVLLENTQWTPRP